MKIDLGKLRGNPEAPLLVIDLLMVLLVLFNLAWIVFNALFAAQGVQAFVHWLAPSFHDWYRADIHPNFADYDMVFITIYVSELLLRWLVAIVRNTYHRWWFYPFIHWYDVLGCIPVGSFRWLRILRVVSLLWRLQQHGVIDLRDTALVRFVRKYYDILVEEVSDRVVVNVLDGVQAELAHGNPVVHRLASEVLAPRRDEIVAALAARVQQLAVQAMAQNRADTGAYVAALLARAMADNPELQRLRDIPAIGGTLAGVLDHAVGDIAARAVALATTDLADARARATLEAALGTTLDTLLARDEALAGLVAGIVDESIAIVKQQVGVQRWKLKEAGGYYD